MLSYNTKAISIVNRLFAIFDNCIDNKIVGYNSSHEMLASAICIISCYSGGFKEMIAIDGKKILGKFEAAFRYIDWYGGDKRFCTRRPCCEYYMRI